MCNRYRVSAKGREIARRYGVEIEETEEFSLPPPEVFPKRPGWVVREDGGARRLEAMAWGFPPPPQGRAPVTNVRNLASPFWRSALARPEARCLVPVTDFCEWGGEAGSKVARWFSVPTQPIFSFAGIWRQTPAGPVYAFLTCEPNALVAPIHPKAMPVILHPEDEARWLQGGMADALALAAPFPSQLMVLAP